MLRRLPAAYFSTVAAIAMLRSVAGVPTVGQLGLTPDRLAAGKVWLLFTSAFVVNGPALLELAAFGATLLVASHALDGKFFALIAPLCHVGGTLLTYAALAVFTGDTDGTHNPAIDYGLSAIWLGLLGAVLVAYMPAARAGMRPARVIAGICTASAVVGVALFPLLSACEHGFGFALGAVVASLQPSSKRLTFT